MTSTKTQKSVVTLRVITAKYGSGCAETRKAIKAGDIVLWNPSSKRTWCSDSKKYNNFITNKS
jgi:hypothetical protein